jgi:hypothetical protein
MTTRSHPKRYPAAVRECHRLMRKLTPTGTHWHGRAVLLAAHAKRPHPIGDHLSCRHTTL